MNKQLEKNLPGSHGFQDKIESILSKIEPNCDRMSTHINFVETVYTNWKSPITWFLSKIYMKPVKSPEIKFTNKNIEYNKEE